MKDPVTSAKLRDGIDHGQAGDKVSFPDPAAAPLGTDDKAADHPPTPERIAMARSKGGTDAAAEAGRLGLKRRL